MQLLLRGKRRQATATVHEAPEDVRARLELFAQRLGPKAARGLRLGLPGDRQPNAEELTRAARTAISQFHISNPNTEAPGISTQKA